MPRLVWTVHSALSMGRCAHFHSCDSLCAQDEQAASAALLSRIDVGIDVARTMGTNSIACEAKDGDVSPTGVQRLQIDGSYADEGSRRRRR